MAFKIKVLTVVLILVAAALAQSVASRRAANPITVIPFELVLDHLYIQVSFNSSSALSVVVDSGAPETAVDRSRSIQLALPASGDALVGGFGNGERTAGQRIAISRISLYGAMLENVAANSVPLDVFNQLLGHTTDAIIGSDLFNKYVVELDYPERVLRLYDPDNYVEPGDGCQLPLSLDTYPMVHAQLVDSDGKTIDARLVLDTGSSHLIVTKSFGDAHPNLPLDGKTIDAPTVKMLSGATRLRLGRVREVNLGGCIVRKPITIFSQDGSGPGVGDETHSGYIGMSIFQQFTTVFDYRHHMVIFRKNHNSDGLHQYDMTGMLVLATGPSFHHFIVDQVVSSSPAAHVGVQAGDSIESVNHIPAAQFTKDDLVTLFRRPGSLRLTISRNGKEMKKQLKLKPMI